MSSPRAAGLLGFSSSGKEQCVLRKGAECAQAVADSRTSCPGSGELCNRQKVKLCTQKESQKIENWLKGCHFWLEALLMGW